MFNKLRSSRLAHTKRAIKLAVSGSLLLSATLSPSLHAFQFQSDGGKVTGSFDSNVTFGIGMRVEDRVTSNYAIGNGGDYPTFNEDDGNLNYDKGDLYSTAVKTSHELEINFSTFSIFTRAMSLYDFDVMRGSTDRTPLSEAAKDDLGHELKFLDAFVTFDTEITNNPVTFKVGSQVLNWGESTFIQNGLNVINPFDVSKFRVAGAQLKDGLLPVPMANVNVEFSENLSMETFYQWSHRKTKIDPAGSYFSTNDFVSPGATYAHIGNGLGSDLQKSNVIGNPAFGQWAIRGADADPEDEGNIGIAFKWYADNLNDTEFGFYMAKYTSRLPVISAFQGIGNDPNNPAIQARTQLLGAVAALQAGDPGNQIMGAALAGLLGSESLRPVAQAAAQAGSAALIATLNNAASQLRQAAYIPTSHYFVEYPEDIKMYGISFNTMIGKTALQGEISRKADQPIQIDDEVLLAATLGAPGQLGLFQNPAGAGIIRGWRPKDVTQYQLTVTELLGKRLGADNITAIAEFGATKIHNLEEKDVLRYEAPATAYGKGFGDSFSWGYRVAFVADYFNFWDEVSIHPTLAYNHDVNGTTPSPIGNFVENRQSLTMALEARYLNEYTAKISYTNFFGGDVHNLVRDRDFVTLSFSKFF